MSIKNDSTVLPSRRISTALAAVAGMVVLLGCDRNATPVAATPDASAPAMTPEAGTAAHTPANPTVAEFLDLTAPVPETWTWRPPSSAMRAANYLVARPENGEDVLLVVFFFGENMGGAVDDNIRRWASQFQSETGGPVAPAVDRGEVDGMALTNVEIVGAYRGMGETHKPDHTFLAAIVEAPVGNVFLRLVGPTSIVEENRAAFETMVAGLRKTAP